jgi:hypothetical protein
MVSLQAAGAIDNGWTIDLQNNVAKTAQGFSISLERRDGMWLLPLPTGVGAHPRD